MRMPATAGAAGTQPPARPSDLDGDEPNGSNPLSTHRMEVKDVTTATLELQPMRDVQPTDRAASATRRDRVVSLMATADPCSKPTRLLSLPLFGRSRSIGEGLGDGDAGGLPIADAVSVLSERRARRACAEETSCDDLTDAEARVLRYLPTHLTVREIGCELYLSANTVKTHVRHIYEKLDAHGRREAVARAQSLGLLPQPSSRPRYRQPVAGESNERDRAATTLGV